MTFLPDDLPIGNSAPKAANELSKMTETHFVHFGRRHKKCLALWVSVILVRKREMCTCTLWQWTVRRCWGQWWVGGKAKRWFPPGLIRSLSKWGQNSEMHVSSTCQNRDSLCLLLGRLLEVTGHDVYTRTQACTTRFLRKPWGHSSWGSWRWCPGRMPM